MGWLGKVAQLGAMARRWVRVFAGFHGHVALGKSLNTPQKVCTTIPVKGVSGCKR